MSSVARDIATRLRFIDCILSMFYWYILHKNKATYNAFVRTWPSAKAVLFPIHDARLLTCFGPRQNELHDTLKRSSNLVADLFIINRARSMSIMHQLLAQDLKFQVVKDVMNQHTCSSSSVCFSRVVNVPSEAIYVSSRFLNITWRCAADASLACDNLSWVSFITWTIWA